MGMPVTLQGASRSIISPMVLGLDASDILFNGDLTSATDQTIAYVRVYYEQTDDVSAATALLSGADCITILPGSAPTELDDLPAAIANVWVCAFSGAGVPANYTGGAGVVNVGGAVADVLANMIRCEFLSADLVKGLRITVPDTWNSGLTTRARVEGLGRA